MNVSRRLIVNCGASKVIAAEVSVDDGNLQIDRLVTVDLVYDVSNEEAFLPCVSDALKTLSKEHGFSGHATLIIPGNFVLTRTIHIPHIEESKRKQIIAFEAQQNIPYSLDEVVWDSQVVSDDGVETEVLFIAAKSEIVNQLCGYMLSAGFQVSKISAATVLDYNTVQFAYPELSEDVLLINIGARSTNLLFCSSDSFYIRNIQLGGNSLTQNIADSLGRSFSRSEQIKHKFFNEVEHLDDDNARVKALNSCGESFMQRMSQEITLSIVNYKRQNKGRAPKQILLNGRGSLLKGLSEKLTEAQKIKVDLFDPLKNVSLEGAIDVETNVLLLQTSEIIGEACNEMVPHPCGINLLPEMVKDGLEFSRKKPLILVAAACFALAFLPPFVSFKMANALYADNVEMIQSGLRPLVEKQDEIRRYQEKSEALSQSIKRVEGLVNSKSNWIRFFADLQKSLHQAEDVWIDSLDVSRNKAEGNESSYEVVLQGRLLVREAVNGLDNIDEDALSGQIKSLRASFENSEFIISSHSPVVVFTNLNKGLFVLPFSINLVVDPTKPL